MQEELDISARLKKTYMYIMESSEKIRMMTVDDRVLTKGNLEENTYPLISTLEKNNVTMADLIKWNIQSIRLIEMTSEKEKVLFEFKPDSIAELLQA